MEKTAHPSVTVVTGQIDAGKTSWCREYAEKNPDCIGLLLEKVYVADERIGYDALLWPSDERLAFARREGHESSGFEVEERVGPFLISREGLLAANTWLANAASHSGSVIVDEIGPLELSGGGLSSGFRRLLTSSRILDLYVVIRSSCLEAVCEVFGLSEYTVVDVESAGGAS